MVTGQRIKGPVAVGINFFVQRIKLPPHNAGFLMILVFAGHATGRTANTEFSVYVKS
jgi:hypothetical protein